MVCVATLANSEAVLRTRSQFVCFLSHIFLSFFLLPLWEISSRKISFLIKALQSKFWYTKTNKTSETLRLSCLVFILQALFNPLKTKRRLLYLKTQSVPRSKHFSSRLQKPINLSCKWHKCCLFSDKYKTHKYSVGRTYNCWLLNCWCITWPVGFKRLITDE